MKTSNFANWQRNRFPGAISISRFPDRRSGYNGPEFPPLMPSSQLLKAYKDGMSWDEYRKHYNEQLLCLNAEMVWQQLLNIVDGAEPVLLCYESAKSLEEKPCHRRLVADWFEYSLDFVIEEWSKDPA